VGRVWARARRLPPRQRAGLTVHALAALALIPGYIWLAPPSRWDDPTFLIALGALAIISHYSTVRLLNGVGFDGAIALMLIAVALAGPLPSLEVMVLPWLANAITGRLAPFRAGALANLVGYGWQAIVAALVLQAVGVHDLTAPSSAGWLILAGAVLYTVGWAIHPAIYGPLWLGQPFRALVRAFVDMLPAAAAMIVLAGLTVLLSGPLGVLALAVFALIAVLPQTYLSYAARVRPVGRLDPATATRRYAHAIAIQLGLSSGQRRHLSRVVSAARLRPPTGDAIEYVCAMLEDPGPANYDAQVATEWWNGRGGPLGLRTEQIPLTARVLTVAHTWSALTAHGTPELCHREALDHLQAVAGVRLDPAVVQAARGVMRQEFVTPEHPAPEPRLHRLRVPAPLRRALTAAASPTEMVGG
jgi:hypothetical protein